MARNLRTPGGEILISRDADIHLTNSKGNTPLHESLRKGMILVRQTSQSIETPTHDDRIRVLHEMFMILLEARGNAMLGLHSLARETPRQLQAEKLDT